jgi:hypothetical protein
MGWYIRKAFSAGPARLNLSKSGLGLSFGVKGARLGVGPRGVYTHLGRGGLYYRSPYGSSRIDVQRTNEPQEDVSLSRSEALFDDKQINYRQLSLDFSFKISKKKEWIFFVIGTVFFFIASQLNNYIYFNWLLLAVTLGIIMYFLVVLYNVKYWILKQKSDRLYGRLKKECCKYDNDDFKVDTGKLKEITEKYRTRLDEGYFKRALYCFYKDYLNSIISDCRISEQEKDEFQKVEDLLKLDKELLKKIKRWIFNRAYLIVIKDKILTKEEEGDIFRIKDILSLGENDVAEELETLNLLKEARKTEEGNLNPINVNFSLSKDEVCYHQTRGRVVKEKILRSYQEQGVRHNIKGLVTEKEGDLYLTSQRIIIVGEGVYNIKLEKIFDIETDIDKNAISMDIDGRKSSLILTVPDSLIFSAKLNKLKVGL